MSLDMFIGIAHLESPAPSGQACKEKAQLPLIVFSFSRKVGRESLEHVKISASVDFLPHKHVQDGPRRVSESRSTNITDSDAELRVFKL